MTATAMITVILIIVCSISGAAMPYVKGEKVFKFIRYLVEVITSAAAGFIMFLLLRVTDIPGEWIAAFSGIAAYFGTRIMNVLYGLLTGRLKVMFHSGNRKDDSYGN